MFNNKHTVLEDGIRYEKRNGLSTKTEEAPGQERIGPGSTLSLSAPTAEMSTTGEDRRGSRPEGVRREGAASRYTRSAASRFASRWTTLIILIMTLIGTARAGTLLACRTRCCLIFAGGRRFSGGRRRAFASGAAELATRSIFPALRRAQHNLRQNSWSLEPIGGTEARHHGRARRNRYS